MRKLVDNSWLFFLSLIICDTNECVAQGLESYGLVGKVKTIVCYHYKPLEDCDYCEDLQRDSTITEFNSSGNIVKETEWNNSHFREDLHKEVTTYKYNENGKIVAETKVGYDGGIQTTKYIRDAQGYIIREEEYMEITAFKKKNEILTSVKYRKNDSSGMTKEISHYSCVGIDKTLSQRDFIDENGYVKKTIYYFDDKTIEETYSREFYSTGRVAKSKVFFDDGGVKEITTWNEKGNKTSYTRYIIDGKGNRKLYSKAVYTYTYDSYGNWNSMKITTNDKYIDIYKRKIRYYK